MVKGEQLTKEGFKKIQDLAKEVNNPFNYPPALSALSNDEV
jgi:hypothetical protein